MWLNPHPTQCVAEPTPRAVGAIGQHRGYTAAESEAVCVSLARARRQFQDGVRWFQALLLLAALFATGLHVPYHLIACAQLGASLLSMHIFVHSSRFEAHDEAGHTPADGAFRPVFYANTSSQLAFGKPSTSSSTRVTLCVFAQSGPNALRSPRRPSTTAWV